jgi:3'(2'), 5'-bisphosphate nucleotidase
MPLPDEDRLDLELAAAKEVARMAWQRIEPFYEGEYEITQKRDGPATEADHAADELIIRELGRRFPGYGILTEESDDNRERLDRDRVWVVDPIDGTKDFIEKAGNFAVQIGLVVRTGDGYVPEVGVVYHAVKDHLYFARRGGGAWVEAPGEPPRRLRVSCVARMEEMAVVVTRSHRTPRFFDLLDLLRPREIFTIGSLGIKAAWVASGRADYYFNNARGFCWEWDACAPDVILSEAGGAMSDFKGLPLRYNREDVCFRDGILASNGACHAELLERILEAEREVRSRPR